MMKTPRFANGFRWGVIGTGRVIPRFMDGFRLVNDAVPAAIYGRDPEKVSAIQSQFRFENAYTDFEKMLETECLDVAYVAVIHTAHLEYARKCLEHGIPVLCEKPMAPSFGQCKELFAVAKQNSLFLMEGMWTRLLPTTKRVKEWISTGRIGKVIALNATFCARVFPNENDRVFDLCQAGGALLDMGVYPLSLADMVFGKSPCAIASLANINRYGVDDNDGIVLQYDDGELATILISLNGQGRDWMTIYGTEGIIEMHEDFWRPRRVVMTNRDGVTEFCCAEKPDIRAGYWDIVSFPGEGFQYEVMHVQDCIRNGLTESPIVPHQSTLNVISICDQLRKQWKLQYPFETL